MTNCSKSILRFTIYLTFYIFSSILLVGIITKTTNKVGQKSTITDHSNIARTYHTSVIFDIPYCNIVVSPNDKKLLNTTFKIGSIHRVIQNENICNIVDQEKYENLIKVLLINSFILLILPFALMFSIGFLPFLKMLTTVLLIIAISPFILDLFDFALPIAAQVMSNFLNYINKQINFTQQFNLFTVIICNKIKDLEPIINRTIHIVATNTVYYITYLIKLSYSL